MTAHHSLDVRHRGDEHVHRWQPRCNCGWSGIPVRRRREAERQYRRHVNSERPNQPRPKPKRPTPTTRLPQELR